MSLLPWDDWFYHISKKEERVDNLYNTYLHQRDTIELKGESYNHQLAQYQSLCIYNAALLIADQNGTCSDSDYAQFLEANEAAKPGKPARPEVAEVLGYISGVTGSYLIGVAACRFGKNIALPFMKDTVQRLGKLLLQDVADAGTEAGVEALGEGVGENVGDSLAEGVSESAAARFLATLSLAGVGNLALAGGIFAAVGIDAILGAIQGAKESKELDKQIGNLNSMLNKVNAYLDTLEESETKLKTGTVEAQSQFLKVIEELKKIQKPPNLQTYPSSTSIGQIPKFLAAAHDAQGFYGVLSNIRNNWHNAKLNNPDLTWHSFEGMANVMMKPHMMSKDDFGLYLDYVAEHSKDIQNTKAKVA